MKPASLTAPLLGLALLLGACSAPADRAASVPGVYFRPNGPYWGGGCQLELHADGTFRSYDQTDDGATPAPADSAVRGRYEMRGDTLLLHSEGKGCTLATVVAAFEVRDGRLCFRNYGASSYDCFEKKQRGGGGDVMAQLGF